MTRSAKAVVLLTVVGLLLALAVRPGRPQFPVRYARPETPLPLGAPPPDPEPPPPPADRRTQGRLLHDAALGHLVDQYVSAALQGRDGLCAGLLESLRRDREASIRALQAREIRALPEQKPAIARALKQLE